MLFVFLIGCNSNKERPLNTIKPVAVSTPERLHNPIKNDIEFYIETLNDKRFDELVELRATKQFANRCAKDYKLTLKKQNIAGVYKQINLDKTELIGEILEYKNEYYCKIYCSGDVILIVWDNAT